MTAPRTAISQRRRWRPWAQSALGAAVLVALAIEFGAGPFMEALASIDPWLLLVATLLTAFATYCAADRWRQVAGSLGLSIPGRAAIAAYYSSQLINATLPGGVLGDVHRGIRRGHLASAVGRSLRSVLWERSSGFVTLVGVAAVTFVVMPSPLQPPGGMVTVIAIALGILLLVASAVAVTLLVGAVVERRTSSAAAARSSSDARWGTTPWRSMARETRMVLGSPRRTIRIVLASLGAITVHVAVFLLAAQALGVPQPMTRLVPIALAILVIGALPFNIAGWGPREGAAALLFAASGLSPSTGLSVSVVYGILALVGTLPGIITLTAGWRTPHDA